jgi:hypothetical protein
MRRSCANHLAKDHFEMTLIRKADALCDLSNAQTRNHAAHAQGAQTPAEPTRTPYVVPIDVSVLNPSIVLKSDGRWDMAYELRRSSLADGGDTTISRIQRLNQDHKPMVEIAGDAVKTCLETRAATASKLGPKKHRERSDGTALPCLREWASDYYTAALV